MSWCFQDRFHLVHFYLWHIKHGSDVEQYFILGSKISCTLGFMKWDWNSFSAISPCETLSMHIMSVYRGVLCLVGGFCPLSRGSLSRWRTLSRRVSVKGSLYPGGSMSREIPGTETCGRYASYLNTFLFTLGLRINCTLGFMKWDWMSFSTFRPLY